MAWSRGLLAVILAALPASGAEPTATDRALAYLAREVPRWRVDNHCSSCHHNADAARALFAAATRKRTLPAGTLANTLAWLSRPAEWDANRGDPAFSDLRLARLQFAAALADARAADLITDNSALEQAAVLVAREQAADGSWNVTTGGNLGSPITHGPQLATALARRTLRRADAGRWRSEVERAGRWLERTEVVNVFTAAAVLYGLTGDDGPAATAQRQRCAELLRGGEAKSGGWGPYVGAAPEPFDTALALLALAESGARDREVVARGRTYLTRSQEADGSWRETTRPAGAESYAHRVSTTGWSALALLRTE